MVPVNVVEVDLDWGCALKLVEVHRFCAGSGCKELLIGTSLMNSAERPLGGA